MQLNLQKPMGSFAKSIQAGTFDHNKLKIMICVALAVITFSVYQQVATHDFINFDDDFYITKNPRVANGLTWENVGWAFRTTYFGNWHPLTWLSYFLDAQMFGVNAPPFLLVNLFIHIASTLLLFLLFNRATQCLWRSALLAALFALHPLHVESVAWASERKDVLCAFFGILTMGAYFSYAKAPTRIRYLCMLVCFMLGMMAKPMLVTLPFVLLLIDYWPLKRVDFSRWPECLSRILMPMEYHPPSDSVGYQKSPVALFTEKIPLLLVVAASAVITIIAQQEAQALAPLELHPLGFRMANALVSYASYVVKMFWPHPLTVFYPFPAAIPLWKIITSGSMLVILSCLTLKYASRFPYLLVGWIWYLGTLVPVIGFLQVGAQAMADRYTYIPLIGIFLMLVWLIFDLAGTRPVRKLVFSSIATIVMLVLITLSTQQVGYWKNSFSLFKHALDTTSESATAHINYGIELIKRARLSEATEHFKAAIRLEPRWAHPYNNLALALSEQGRLKESLVFMKEAIRIDPTDPTAVANYNRIEKTLSLKLDAIAILEKKSQQEPTSANIQIEIGKAYQQIHEIKKAIVHYRNALVIDGTNATARSALATSYAMTGNYQEAEIQLQKVIEAQPQNIEACYLLAGLYGRQNRAGLTLEWLKKAVEKGFNNWTYLKIDPNFIFLRNNPEFDRLIHPPPLKG